MKRCPQCNNIFDDQLLYCPTDGMLLIAEEFVLPSESAVPIDEEEITVIRHEPVTIDISQQTNAPTEQFRNPVLPAQAITPIIVQRQRNTGKYIAFLFVGLLLGAALVLATMFLAKNFYQNKTTEVAVNVNRNAQANSTGNAKVASDIPKAPDPKHQQRTGVADDEFNGRVIAANAYVRASPNRNSAETDVLPVGDRLTIQNRENDNSPWFFVTCEHGASGWMHGNTIEYTR
jgi:hypothetical protein